MVLAFRLFYFALSARWWLLLLAVISRREDFASKGFCEGGTESLCPRSAVYPRKGRGGRYPDEDVEPLFVSSEPPSIKTRLRYNTRKKRVGTCVIFGALLSRRDGANDETLATCTHPQQKI